MGCTLFAAGLVLLLTNLPLDTWPAARILVLYRIRWQVEMLFKHFKGLLHLDGLRAQDPRLAQAYLRGKLLGALLLDELTQASTAYVPDWFTSLERPVSPWRLTACWTMNCATSCAGKSLWPMRSVAYPDCSVSCVIRPGSAPNNWLGREPSCSICLFV
jgi:hypothetical protein